LDIAERNEQVAAQNTVLVVNQFGNGVATTLDMAQARSQQATIAASIPPLRTQQAALINAIGLLLAEQPRALEAELKPRAAVPGVPLLVPVGLPNELVRRRPDVREAEARLHAATAATGVAVASFYPDIALNGAADLNGLAFANAFSLPSGAFQVGPTLSIPLFEGGKLTGQLRLRKSEQREAAIDFQKTVLHAWQEVDDALTGFAEAQQQRIETTEATRQNAAALQAARQRYEQGAGDFLNVTASESQLLQSENALATINTEIATDLVALYRTLGGGWQAADTGAVQGSGG
jgi:NodT family efflux transporter outer membrane factor (OMF) lipoprotein